MGNFYANITVKGPTQDQVVEYLTAESRAGYVSPTVEGCTVVYDREAEENPSELDALAQSLSSRFACPALAVFNYDDDALLCTLYERGEHRGAFHAAPEELMEEIGSAEAGDPKNLCAAFGSSRVEDVRRLIEASYEDDPELAFAVIRHARLAEALGLPGLAAGSGYLYIEMDNLGDGINRDAFQQVGG